jgi:hypothetical protein
LRDPHEGAAKQLDDALAMDRGFPENPFRGKWDAFYFFDPDLLFESQFVDKLKLLLSCENGSCVCMRNLDVECPGGTPEESSMFFDIAMNGNAYMDRLRGGGPASGWLYRMDRYGYASDAGHWSIYCERANEIAAIAVRWDGPPGRFAEPLRQFDALPIGEAIQRPSSYGLSPDGLPEAWRAKMLQTFGSAPGSAQS